MVYLRQNVTLYVTINGVITVIWHSLYIKYRVTLDTFISKINQYTSINILRLLTVNNDLSIRLIL